MIKIRLEVSPLASNNLSGVGYYTKLLAEALYKNNDVSLEMTNFNFLNRQPSPNPNTKIIPTESHLIPLRLYAKMQSYGIAPPFDIAKKPVDLTIFTNYACWPTVNSKHVAVVVHDLTFLHFPELMEEKNLAHLKRVVPRALTNSDFIITVSETIKKELVKEYKIDSNKIIVTTIPPDDFFKKKNNDDVFKKYDIKTKKYIYTIGTIEPRKNLPTLISAYLKLPAKIRTEYSLIIAGGMGWKSEESKQAIDNAIQNGENIKYLGYIDQKMSNALHQQASLHASASFYEGFGMPILESIAGGTPVVLSDIPVYHEVGGNISLFADPNNAQDFANKIEAALTDKKFREDFNKNCQTHLNKFSWSKNVDSILNKELEMLKLQA